MIKLDKFWRTTPNIIIQAIAVGLISLGVGCGVAVGLSTGVKISKEGVEVQRQAYKNQVELEKAVEVIDIYEQGFDKVQEKATQTSRRNSELQGFAEEVEEIKQTVQGDEVEDIKLTILESKKVLKEESQTDSHRDSENRRSDS